MEDVKLCPLLGKECQYAHFMLFNEPIEQCSISVIAVELQSTSADTCAINDSLENISKEMCNVVTAVKGLV